MLMDLAWSCYIAGSIWGDDYLGGLAVLHHGIQGPIPHHKQDCRGSQPLCAFKSTSNNGVLCMIGVGAIVLNVPQPMTSHDHPSLPLSLSPSLPLSLSPSLSLSLFAHHPEIHQCFASAISWHVLLTSTNFAVSNWAFNSWELNCPLSRRRWRKNLLFEDFNIVGFVGPKWGHEYSMMAVNVTPSLHITSGLYPSLGSFNFPIPDWYHWCWWFYPDWNINPTAFLVSKNSAESCWGQKLWLIVHVVRHPLSHSAFLPPWTLG